MSKSKTIPTNEEILFGENEIIVSKTDLKGNITYANDVFCRVAEMTTSEVIGAPHSLIRHPDMPRVVFKLLWDSVQKGQEIFAYVKNMSKTGKYYWVLAHVTPSYDQHGRVDGYHSNRRTPDASILGKVKAFYQSLSDEEDRHTNSKIGLAASTALLETMLSDQGKSYSEFIWALGE